MAMAQITAVCVFLSLLMNVPFSKYAVDRAKAELRANAAPQIASSLCPPKQKHFGRTFNGSVIGEN